MPPVAQKGSNLFGITGGILFSGFPLECLYIWHIDFPLLQKLNVL